MLISAFFSISLQKLINLVIGHWSLVIGHQLLGVR
jgi:hypothetical protein